ncbi:MAG: hypothetical protein U9R75_06560, partial [Candidatus Thermoplasmatota archaeon]|nr:hypothetical protein [Candidatus Thermoplasmatota archaeon]
MARVCGISSILLMIMVVLSSTFGVLNVVSDISGEVVEVLDQTISIEKNGNWTVTGNEIYTSESIDLNGNLSIFGTLVLDNTDLTLNSTCEGVPWIIVHNGGKLVVRNGSIVRGRSDIRYTFSSERTSSVLINHSIIRNCGLPVMEHWMMGIYTESKDFKVLNSKIENGGTGIVGAGACMDLCGTNVAEMDSWGVVLMNGSYLNASVVNITDCIDGGITTTNSTADLRMLYFENVMISLDVVGSVVNTTSSTLFGLTPISGLFNSSTVILERCMPSRFGGDLLKVANPMSGPTDLLMINSTFPEVLVLDMGADVRSSVLFDVVVHTNHDPPAGNADIEIKDRFGTIVYQGLANDDGRIEDMPIVVARYNTTNIIEMTPHNLSVKYEGGSRYKDFFANQHHSVEIDVILNDPEVSIDHPENGSWISSGEFFLKGRIMDRRSITDLWISIDGSPDVSVPNGDTFSIPLNLPDGHHSLGMTARNDDGKYGNSTVSFNIDTVFPELIITSPGSPFYTNTSNVMIEGTCSSDAELYIGLTRIPHPDGSFKTNPILDDGRNDITLRAVDRAGNAVSAHLTVFRDANPPVLLILSPLNGTRTSRDSIMVMGSVDEDTQRVFIDNEVVILADGKFEHDVALEHEGSNRIKIIAEDVTGTRTVKVISVIKDTTPPDVAITYAPSLTRNESITIRGTVDPGSTLLVNNRITAVDGGVFMTEVDLIEGENSIMVIAKDDLGNERAINRMIRLDTIAPILDRLEPPSGTHVTNPILQLHGEVYDEVG